MKKHANKGNWDVKKDVQSTPAVDLPSSWDETSSFDAEAREHYDALVKWAKTHSVPLLLAAIPKAKNQADAMLMLTGWSPAHRTPDAFRLGRDIISQDDMIRSGILIAATGIMHGEEVSQESLSAITDLLMMAKLSADKDNSEEEE